jgi:hypothetical protein
VDQVLGMMSHTHTHTHPNIDVHQYRPYRGGVLFVVVELFQIRDCYADQMIIGGT